MFLTYHVINLLADLTTLPLFMLSLSGHLIHKLLQFENVCLFSKAGILRVFSVAIPTVSVSNVHIVIVILSIHRKR
jgi:hypothetical protein